MRTNIEARRAEYRGLHSTGGTEVSWFLGLGSQSLPSNYRVRRSSVKFPEGSLGRSRSGNWNYCILRVNFSIWWWLEFPGQHVEKTRPISKLRAGAKNSGSGAIYLCSVRAEILSRASRPKTGQSGSKPDTDNPSGDGTFSDIRENLLTQFDAFYQKFNRIGWHSFWCFSAGEKVA